MADDMDMQQRLLLGCLQLLGAPLPPAPGLCSNAPATVRECSWAPCTARLLQACGVASTISQPPPAGLPVLQPATLRTWLGVGSPAFDGDDGSDVSSLAEDWRAWFRGGEGRRGLLLQLLQALVGSGREAVRRVLPQLCEALLALQDEGGGEGGEEGGAKELLAQHRELQPLWLAYAVREGRAGNVKVRSFRPRLESGVVGVEVIPLPFPGLLY